MIGYKIFSYFVETFGKNYYGYTVYNGADIILLYKTVDGAVCIFNYLSLQLYASNIAESEELVKMVEELLAEQHQVWGRVQQQLDKNACLVGYLRSATI